MRGEKTGFQDFHPKPNLIQCFSVYPSLLDGFYLKATAKFLVVRGLSWSPPAAVLYIQHGLDAWTHEEVGGGDAENDEQKPSLKRSKPVPEPLCPSSPSLIHRQDHPRGSK